MKKITVILMGIYLLMNAAMGYSQVDDENNVLEEKGTKIPYLSGGIGTDEREALSEEAKNYNLKIVFATKGKAYLADIAVQIKDESGNNLVDATSDGPWFFASLAPGKYTIIATMKEEALSQKVEIKQGGKSTLYFFWAE
jgi:hypothetical protein